MCSKNNDQCTEKIPCNACKNRSAFGFNIQKRNITLHHLDVPWIPSLIEHREERIEHQGNNSSEIMMNTNELSSSIDASITSQHKDKQ
jgi:hypothetical protein